MHIDATHHILRRPLVEELFWTLWLNGVGLYNYQ